MAIRILQYLREFKQETSMMDTIRGLADDQSAAAGMNAAAGATDQPSSDGNGLCDCGLPIDECEASQNDALGGLFAKLFPSSEELNEIRRDRNRDRLIATIERSQATLDILADSQRLLLELLDEAMIEN